MKHALLLKGAELFHHIANEELVPLALIAQEQSFPAGATLIRQGEPGDCLYILVAGEASINIRGVGTVARRRQPAGIAARGDEHLLLEATVPLGS